MKTYSITFFLLCSLFLSSAYAQDSTKVTHFIKNTEISGQWFISGNYEDQDSLYQIELKRGYFTIESHINENLTARYTQDITLDTEGDDAGNVEMRLKYLYLQTNVNVLSKYQEGTFSLGMVPRPWIEFEQKINKYRVMGPMFLEKTEILSSADFGFIYEGLIGGEIDEKYQKEVNSGYPGKYGSFSFGLYNGGGYHDVEKNNNKTFEARFTIRPFPAKIPGIQTGYAFAIGKANVPNNTADFNMNVFYISSESKYHVLMGQYYSGVGDYGGRYLDTAIVSYKNSGYSLFGEFKIPKSPFSLVGRYDYFTSKQNPDHYLNRIGGGIAYKFSKNKLMLDYEYCDKNKVINRMIEMVLEIRF